MIAHLFTIPLPPSVNTNTRFGKGKAYSTKAYQEFKRIGADMIRNHQPKIRTYDTPVNVALTVGLKKNRRGRPVDIDNYVKPAMDLLQQENTGPVLLDDNYKHVRSVSITYDPEMGEEMRVKIQPIGGPIE